MNPAAMNIPEPLRKDRPAGSEGKIGGLDTVRFFAALWVVFCHGGMPPLFTALQGGGVITRALGAVYVTLFNGQAAVILFFIVSGFCIHFPQTRGGRPLHVPSFYARRVLRIAIPWAAMEAFIRLWGADKMMMIVFHMITWTLKCEVSYYIAYPLFLYCARRSPRGWLWLLGISFPIAFGVVAMFLAHLPICGTGKFQVDAPAGLPAWLLGCMLAENFARKPEVTMPPIWLCRVVIIALGAGCLALQQYFSIGLPWTLNLFAVPAYFYVYAEISHSRRVKPFRVLEALGAASYSMYLTHMFIVHTLRNVLPPVSTGTIWLHWATHISAVFAMTFVWYFAIEFPSHQLARKFRRPNKVKAGALVDVGSSEQVVP